MVITVGLTHHAQMCYWRQTKCNIYLLYLPSMVLGKGIATNSQFLKSQQACITMTVHVMMSSLRQLLIVIVANYEQVISKGIYSIA